MFVCQTQLLESTRQDGTVWVYGLLSGDTLTIKVRQATSAHLSHKFNSVLLKADVLGAKRWCG